ncbi:MAG: hypothetical protein KIT16_05935 [Rhodospirillaceae bacterium]|nr:hypothetical protein [Rhodospirillaceae bacterium]
MPSFRIFYVRDDASGPESITANFSSLEQALDVFAARGLRIVYIAEQERPGAAKKKPRPGRQSFPVRRFSMRAVA